MVKTPEQVDAFQQYYSRPPALTAKESFKRFLYNSEDKSVFGRTAPSWSKFNTFFSLNCLTLRT